LPNILSDSISPWFFKFIVMKKLALFLLSAIPLLAFAQFPIPVPLTDSFSDNRNPDIIQLSNYQALMVWEKSNSPDSTAIYGQLIYPSGQQSGVSFKIIGKSGVHFTNPKLLFNNHSGFPGQDTIVHIYFESDETGNQDILLMKYDGNGFLYGPFSFADGAGDQKNLGLSESYYQTEVGLTWQSNDQVFCSRANWSNPLQQYTFSSPVLIDSGNLNRPAIDVNGRAILWEKEYNGVVKVAFSLYDYMTQTWSVPVVKNKAGENGQISPVKGLWGMDGGIFVWNSLDGNQRHLYGHSFTMQDSLDKISNFNMREPAGAFAPILVKSTQEMFGVLLAYTSDSLGNDEIFYDWFFSGNQNLSNSPVADQKPEVFFLGQFGFWVYEVIITWESFHNGHWQLWYSYLDMAGGLNETGQGNIDLQVIPNPFQDNLKLEFSLPEDQEVRFRILNSLGISLLETPLIQGVQGFNSIDLTSYLNRNGKKLNPGLYYVEMSLKTEKKTVKAVKI